MNSSVTIFITLLIILWSVLISLCNETSSIVRQKREPPVYRYIKQSYRTTFTRRKPKPFYGPPPRTIYRPKKPKSVYGPPPKPIYGPPPKPVYGPPPRPVYGPPPEPVYGPPPAFLSKPAYSSSPKPIYGPPSVEFSYESPVPDSIHKPPPLSYENSGLSSISHYENNKNNYELYSTPSESYKPPPEPNYGIPFSSYSSYKSNNEPLSDYNVPHFEEQPTLYDQSSSKYETSYQSYEIPTTHETPKLDYDSSSASYETPGALNSYGVPINQYSQPEPIFSQSKDNLIKIVQNNFSPSSISHQYVHLKRQNERNNNNNKNKIKQFNEIRPLNHNYDGLGIEENIFEESKNLDKNTDESQSEIEILKSHSFNYFGGKSNSLTKQITIS